MPRTDSRHDLNRFSEMRKNRRKKEPELSSGSHDVKLLKKVVHVSFAVMTVCAKFGASLNWTVSDTADAKDEVSASVVAIDGARTL